MSNLFRNMSPVIKSLERIIKENIQMRSSADSLEEDLTI